jgi:hypothetical protein
MSSSLVIYKPIQSFYIFWYCVKNNKEKVMINNNINIIPIVPIHSYLNADTQKKLIYLDNKNKSGIYH